MITSKTQTIFNFNRSRLNFKINNIIYNKNTKNTNYNNYNFKKNVNYCDKNYKKSYVNTQKRSLMKIGAYFNDQHAHLVYSFLNELREELLYFLFYLYRFLILTIFRILNLWNAIILSSGYYSYIFNRGISSSDSMSTKPILKQKKAPKVSLLKRLINGPYNFCKGLVPPLFGIFDPSLILYFSIANFIISLFDIRGNTLW